MAALVGGVIYAFASAKLFYASLGQFNIASSQWAPFCVLYLLRMVRPAVEGAARQHDRVRSAALAALFFGFQLWAELTYASFLAIFVALLFVWHISITRRRTCARAGCDLLLPYLLFWRAWQAWRCCLSSGRWRLTCAARAIFLPAAAVSPMSSAPI